MLLLGFGNSRGQSMAKAQILKLTPSDNIAVAMSAIAAGTWLAAAGLAAAEDIPSGHKLALASISAGEVIVKYGQVIGVAT